MSQSKMGNPDLKMKVSVVTDDANMREIMLNYLKENGFENTTPPEEIIMPLAIFWLKK